MKVQLSDVSFDENKILEKTMKQVKMFKWQILENWTFLYNSSLLTCTYDLFSFIEQGE